MVVVVGQLAGVTLGPSDRRLDARSDGQHARADVEPGDRACAPDSPEGFTGNDASATGHVQNSIAGGHPGGVEQRLGLLPEQRVDVKTLVGPRPLDGRCRAVRHDIALPTNAPPG